MKIRSVLFTVVMSIMFASCPGNDPNPIPEPELESDLTENLIEGSISRDGVIAGDVMVVIQNVATGQSYQVLVDDDGNFSVPVAGYAPRLRVSAGRSINNREISGAADTYVIALVDADGKPLGTVVYGTSGTDLVTGLDVSLGASLDIMIPADPLNDPIPAAGEIEENTAVLCAQDADGVPVGTESYGKGDEAQGTVDISNVADPDGDGLISILDADDDGDGIADEFDADSDAGFAGLNSVKVSFGFLLDLEETDVLDYYPKSDLPDPMPGAPSYYGPSTDDERLQLGLVRDMRLDVWILPEDGVNVTNAVALESPAPAYMDELYTGPAQAPYLWYTQLGANESHYAVPVQAAPDRKTMVYFLEDSQNSFAVGDTFTFQITEADKYPYLVSKMINFVFKKPFLFLRYGPASASLTDYAPTYSGENKISINTVSDLVLDIMPPQDETGSPLVSGATFEFSINYIDAGGNQINNLDTAATNTANWPVAPLTDGVAWEGRRWHEGVEQLDYITGDPDGAFRVTIPAALFKTSILDDSGASHTVGSYIIGASFQVGTYGTWETSIIQNRISCVALPPS